MYFKHVNNLKNNHDQDVTANTFRCIAVDPAMNTV